MYPEFMNKIKLLYDQDMISQEHYLSVLGEKVRNLPAEVFFRYQSFFVPNEDYLRNFWGEGCVSVEHEIYGYDGLCNLNNCIVIPCLLLNGSAVGWVAFNPFTKAKAFETGDYSESYYSYPTKNLFNKGDYLFGLPEVFKKAISDGYIVITDGVFDAISLTHYGLNACSALGSFLNEKSAFILQFIDKVYVSLDNDEAGLKMLDNVRKFKPSVRYIKQGSKKDIDDFLKTERREELVREVLKGVEFGTDVVIR